METPRSSSTRWRRRSAGVSVSVFAHVAAGIVLALFRLVIAPTPAETVIDARFHEPILDPLAEPPRDLVIAALGNPVESEIPRKAIAQHPDPSDLLPGPRQRATSPGLGQGKITSGDGGQRGDGGGAFFGVDLAARSIVFVIDRSGSMQGERFGRVAKELDHAINSLNEAQTFNVLMYNNEVRTIFSEHAETTLLKTTKLNQKTALRRVGYTQPQGGTDGALAIRKALKMKPEAILFLTDGEFDLNLQEIFRLNKQETVIHTITLGNGQSAPLLKRLAELTSGTYRHVNIEPHVDPAVQVRIAQAQAKARALTAQRKAIMKLSREELLATQMLDRLRRYNKRGTRTKALREAKVFVTRFAKLPQVEEAKKIIAEIERIQNRGRNPLEALQARAQQPE